MVEKASPSRAQRPPGAAGPAGVARWRRPIPPQHTNPLPQAGRAATRMEPFFGTSLDAEDSRPHFDREMTSVISGPVPGARKGRRWKNQGRQPRHKLPPAISNSTIPNYRIAVGASARRNESRQISERSYFERAFKAPPGGCLSLLKKPSSSFSLL